MRRFSLLLLSLGVLAASFVYGGGATGAVSQRPATLTAIFADREFVPGELIVRFKPGISAASRTTVIRDEGGRLGQPLPLPGTVLVRLSSGESPAAAADAFEQHGEVVYAEPNRIYHVSAAPNDPRFPDLWGLNQDSDVDIDATDAWDRETGDPSVIVAVVDSGVAFDHPDIAPNRWVNNDPPGNGDEDGNGKPDDTFGWDFVQEDNTPYDYNGHGTHVAGTIGAQGNNSAGVTGVNWDVQLMSLRAGDAEGSLETTDIVKAFAYACAEGARVVNGSFGSSGVSQSMYNAIVSPGCANTLFVFAAGNDGVNNDLVPQYPCNYHRPGGYGAGAANVVCVAATTDLDELADFSNYGVASVHLAAPGADILSTWPAYQTILPSDGFDDPVESIFDARWSDRIDTMGAPPWGRTTLVKDSGTHSLTDSPSGNYANNSTTTIRLLAPLGLGLRIGCKVSYDLLLDTLGSDWFLVRVGSTTEATTIAGGWSGFSNGEFIPLSTDLSVIEGAPIIWLRLALESSPTFASDGVYVDDLSVACLDHTTYELDSISGTSMASPHVAGVAALALAQNPALTTAELKTRLLSAVDPLPQLVGAVSTGGRLNACRSLVGCVPSSPTPPPPPPVDPPPPPVDPPPPPIPPAAPPPPPPPPPVVRPPVARCVVPNVKGKTVPAARTALARARCALGRVSRAYSRRVGKSRIISQSRRAASRHPRGTRVNVVVSRGRRR